MDNELCCWAMLCHRVPTDRLIEMADKVVAQSIHYENYSTLILWRKGKPASVTVVSLL